MSTCQRACFGKELAQVAYPRTDEGQRTRTNTTALYDHMRAALAPWVTFDEPKQVYAVQRVVITSLPHVCYE